ncbi:MAG: pyridoxamine 5'-phosphate oxidase [Chitinophagales bacterium]|nr:pyridoxamine 5'-phosphate oxidase [Chitinophagales bacterium]
MPNRDLQDFRQDYSIASLEIEQCADSPFEQFATWLNNAIKANVIEPNAMSLATVDENLQPKVRTVLLKEFTIEGFVFYTNYESDKAKEMTFSNKVSLLFWWINTQQQIRIEGTVKKISETQSKAYFYSRPKGSQVGATVSPQSKIIVDRRILDDLFDQKMQQYQDSEVPFPNNWGGYIVEPTYFEFWQGRSSRLHDRVAYQLENNSWKKVRLAP